MNHIEDGIVAAQNPRNLLDNSDFTNPVNQRGQTDYTSNGYTIDRWELYFGAVGVSSLGYITTSGQMYQKIAIPTDKVYTFAIENDAGIAVVTGIPANGIHSATLGNALIKLATIGEYVEVVIEPSEGYNIACAYWAALYEGSYTADTLPPYVPKENEIVSCREYYREYGDDGIYCYCYTNDYLTGFDFDIPMRIAPSILECSILRLNGFESMNIGASSIMTAKGVTYIHCPGAVAGEWYRITSLKLDADL